MKELQTSVLTRPWMDNRYLSRKLTLTSCICPGKSLLLSSSYLLKVARRNEW
jgi:hypothetical protein